ncbi:MAG TPA: hypothetical protein VIO85_12425 [Candidatus Dormibacteraeota bacterium]
MAALIWLRRRGAATLTMLDQERLALDPGALVTNRAGKLSPRQRSKLRARATGALIGLIATSTFAVIAWLVAWAGPKVWIVAALIATVAAPLAFWAFDRIRADLRGRVISVTGVLVLKYVDDEDHRIHAEVGGRPLRLPSSMMGILDEPGQVTAYFTRWSGMLVNIAPAAADEMGGGYKSES